MKTTEIYRGIEIEINHDQHAENPFENWDCNPPLMSKYDRYLNDYSKGDINDYLSNILTDGQIIRHQKELADAFDIDLDDYKEREFSKDDKISDIRYEIRKSEDFDALETVCILSKTPYLNTYSRGYSQGDHADVFTCYTKTFEDVTGCTIEHVREKETLQGAVKLYGFWAWGDVYGFYIPEIEDSCAGFYGSDHEKSGLMEGARESIDSHFVWLKKQKESKLKELIKSRVPFIYRKNIINQTLTT